MLLLVTGRSGSTVVSRGGKRPLRLFLQRHGIRGEINTITPKLHLANITLKLADWKVLRGLTRTSFKFLFLHALTAAPGLDLVERAPAQDDRRQLLQSQFLELKGIRS